MRFKQTTQFLCIHYDVNTCRKICSFLAEIGNGVIADIFYLWVRQRRFRARHKTCADALKVVWMFFFGMVHRIFLFH